MHWDGAVERGVIWVGNPPTVPFRGAKAHWNAVGTPELSVLLAESASKVWVSQVWAERGMDTRQEAEADSGCEFKHSIILMSTPIQKSQNRSWQLALWHTKSTRFERKTANWPLKTPKFARGAQSARRLRRFMVARLRRARKRGEKYVYPSFLSKNRLTLALIHRS